MSPAQERTSRTRQSACKTRHLVGLKSAALSGRKRVACSTRSEEHTSELQSRLHLVCRLLLEKKKNSRDHMFMHLYDYAAQHNLHIRVAVFVQQRDSVVRAWRNQSSGTTQPALHAVVIQLLDI